MKNFSLDLKQEDTTIEITEDTEISNVVILKKGDNIRLRIKIIHKLPNLKSRINFKVVLFDNARFDMEGILKVLKGAIKTDTYLKIKCLVIGENAYARAIPSLEINESEVKAGHGASMGYLDEEDIYYLRSKGLNQLESEKILIQAYINNN